MLVGLSISSARSEYRGDRNTGGYVDMKEPINTICPWSGDHVSLDSLAPYRDHTVGFCNQGCRDKFLEATNTFDEKISASQIGAAKAWADDGAVYQPRHFSGRNPLEIGPATFKSYLIDLQASLPPADALRQAASLAIEDLIRLGSVPAEAIGFVILHRGEEANWLLVHWWADGGILHGLTFRAHSDSMVFEPAPTGLMACVWEQVVIGHERQAWIDNVMQATARIGGYLGDMLRDGQY